jgi:hypothetical protein
VYTVCFDAVFKCFDAIVVLQDASSHTYHHRFSQYPQADRENIFPLVRAACLSTRTRIASVAHCWLTDRHVLWLYDSGAVARPKADARALHGESHLRARAGFRDRRAHLDHKATVRSIPQKPALLPHWLQRELARLL